MGWLSFSKTLHNFEFWFPNSEFLIPKLESISKSLYILLVSLYEKKKKKKKKKKEIIDWFM